MVRAHPDVQRVPDFIQENSGETLGFLLFFEMSLLVNKFREFPDFQIHFNQLSAEEPFIEFSLNKDLIRKSHQH